MKTKNNNYTKCKGGTGVAVIDDSTTIEAVFFHDRKDSCTTTEDHKNISYRGRSRCRAPMTRRSKSLGNRGGAFSKAKNFWKQQTDRGAATAITPNPRPSISTAATSITAVTAATTIATTGSYNDRKRLWRTGKWSNHRLNRSDDESNLPVVDASLSQDIVTVFTKPNNEDRSATTAAGFASSFSAIAKKDNKYLDRYARNSTTKSPLWNDGYGTYCDDSSASRFSRSWARDDDDTVANYGGFRATKFFSVAHPSDDVIRE